MIKFVKNWLECRRLYQTHEVQEFIQCLYDIDYWAWHALKKYRATSYLHMLQHIQYWIQIGIAYPDIFSTLVTEWELKYNPYINHTYLELQALFEGN